MEECLGGSGKSCHPARECFCKPRCALASWGAKQSTPLELFLSEMEAVPWKSLIHLIELHYPRTSIKGCRPPYPMETMLRIHLLQQWYDLSDPAIQRWRMP